MELHRTTAKTLESKRPSYFFPALKTIVTEYNDDYPTCSSTYATLRVYFGAISPDEISSRLNLEPSRTQFAEVRGPGIMDVPAGWFLTSEGAVDSNDVRRHLDWLLHQIADKSSVFDSLRSAGVSIDVFCYWLSASGHGGPTLSPTQMSVLASLGLDVGFDVYGT